MIFILSSLALLVGTFWGYLQTSHAQKNIIHLITTTVKAKTGYHVEIEAISFPLPFNWKAQNIQLYEDEHLLFTIGHADIFFPFWELLGNTIALESVSLKDVHVSKIPRAKQKIPVALSGTHELPWKEISYNIRFSKLDVQKFSIANSELPKYIPENTFPLDIEGSLVLNLDKHSANIDLSAKKHADEEQQSSTHLNISWQGFDQQSFNMQLLENRKGLLSKIIDLPLPYDLKFAVEGKVSSNQSYEGQFSIHLLKNQDHQTSNNQIRGIFSYSQLGLLNVHSVEGEVGPICLAGDLSFQTEDLKIEENHFKVKILECEKLKKRIDFPIKGSLEAIASVAGNLKDPLISLKIIGNNLEIADEPLEHLIGEATLSKSNKGFTGNSFVSLSYLNTRFRTDAQIGWDDDRFYLSNLKANYGDATLEGDLNYTLKHKIYHGTLLGSVADSGFLQKLFNIDIAGSSAWEIKLHGNSENELEQDVDFAFHAERGRYSSLRIQKIEFFGTLHNIFKNPAAFLYLTAEHALFNGWRIGKLKAETAIEQNKELWHFMIKTEDPTDRGIFGEMNGVWSLNADAFKFQLDHFNGSFKEHRFSLHYPIELSMEKDIFNLSPVMMTVDNGTLFTTVDYSPEHAHATTRLENIPVEIFYPSNFILPFTGLITGEIFLFGEPGSLTGQLNTKLTGIRINEEAFAHVPPFQATLSGNLFDTKFLGSANISGVTKNPIEIKAELPIHASLNPPELIVNYDAPIQGYLTAEGEIAPLLQLLIIDSNSLSGNTSIALNVKGSFSNPYVEGQMTLSNGTFESPNTGAIYRNIYAELEALDKTLILKKLSAIDLSDGIISGEGTLHLDREKSFPFVLNLELSRIRLLNLDFVKAIASGHISITGNSRKGKIVGNLKTDSVQATIPDQTQAVANSLNVRYINLPKGEVSPISMNTRPRWPLELNVQIDVPNNASIKAKDLYTYWHGGVNIQGMAHEPLLFGDFKIINGEYHFNGKTFDIKEGTISIAGEPDKKTTLYVIASKDLGKIVAEVILKGSVKNPSISFRSNPPMSQRDILSWILFGRSSSDITPFQGSELSQSIRNLAKGINKSPDMLTKIRNKIGIDRIDISKTEGNESNEVSIQVGKYISRGVFVSVNKSITAEANQIGIEANLLPNIKAEAQVGDDSSAKLQLKWKHDY